jgi:hypothetical protein
MRIILSSLFLVFILGLNAQSVNSNVLSFYGLGERALGNHSIYDALGTNNFNLLDSTQLNFFNPSSYSLMSSGNTLFSFGIYGRTSKYIFNENSEYRFSAMPDHFALGFKLRKRMGMSFGLKPFSVRGYSFTQKVFTGSDSIKYVYSGKGGIQELYLGFSIGILQKRLTKLAIGINASYLFGKLENERKSILIDPNTISGGIGRNAIDLKAFHFELGTFFRKKIGKKQEFTVSAVFAPSQNLNVLAREELYAASNVNNLGTYDTLDYTETPGKIKLGLENKIGLSYELLLPDLKKSTRSLHPQFTILASYTSMSPFTHSFQTLSAWKNESASKFALGIQFKPEAKLYENISTLKFFEKISYRFGAYSLVLPYSTLLGNRYFEQAFTFGFGMPILAQQGLSSLNLSINIGKRGVNEEAYTKEEFLTFNFGLVVSPSSFDRWFRKRKLD